MKKIMLIILFLLAIPIVQAVGVGAPGGPNKFVEFEPGKSVIFQYLLRSNRHGTIGYQFGAEGDLAKYLTFYPKQFDRIDSTGGTIHTPFSVGLDLPQVIDEPGIHEIWVTASEVAPAGAGVIALSRIKFLIEVRVLFPGYKIEADLVAPNINENEVSNMKVSISNWGTYPVNSIKAKIDVFDDDKILVGTVYTNEDSIPVRGSTTLDSYFDSTGLPPGNYSATAEIEWDGGIEIVDDTFLIGTKVVDVTNHTKTLFKDTINPFKINIKSRWNNKLNNVYAIVRLEGKDFKTPSLNIDNLGETQLEAYIDTTGMERGNKEVQIVLYFENYQTVYTGEVEILNKPLEEAPVAVNTLTISLILIVLLLVLLNILILLYLKRKKRR